jgi:DNA-binding winged helix-turn-helix (wHTH) protein
MTSGASVAGTQGFGGVAPTGSLAPETALAARRGLGYPFQDAAYGSLPGSQAVKISFADCVLAIDARQLWRAGKVVPLEPKMYELLEVLIQRRPAVVTNEELDELLWPKVYVARTSLTRLVSELRALLGDKPQESKIIRTVYKKGYAFCADVNSLAAPPAGLATISLVWNDRVIPLAHGEHIAGRGAECSLVIDAATVSRRHARIRVASGGATIEDLSSTNGTQVNGALINAPTALENGQRILLGSEVLVVRARDTSALTIKTDGSRNPQPGGQR